MDEGEAAGDADPLARREDCGESACSKPPLSAEPTYEHLKKGLVRVILDLPDNLDVIDVDGNVITGPARGEPWNRLARSGFPWCTPASMLTFLHTAHAHIQTFETLVREQNDAIPVRHEVREGLLAIGREQPASEQVKTAVHAVIRELARDGATFIVCTCATIAAVAEATPASECRVMRIDRPLAEYALESKRRLLVVATLPTALRETLGLLDQVAREAQRSPEVEQLLVPHAWAFFERGDMAGYLAEVRNAIQSRARARDLVLLAQASMAPVVELLESADFSVMANPKIGVAAAVAEYERLERTANK